MLKKFLSLALAGSVTLTVALSWAAAQKTVTLPKYRPAPALTKSPSPNSEDAIVCSGINLMPMMERDAPKIAAALRWEAASIPYGTGLTWKIEKDGVKPSYLFGTIHMADPRLQALRPAAQKAFDDSSTLALEITEILDKAKLAKVGFSVMQYTMYTDDTTLDQILPPDAKAKIEAKATEKLGLPWSVAGRMKPWTLMGALARPACESAREKANMPIVDANLGKRAKEQGKEIVALETLVGQLQAMDSLPEEFSVNGLIQSVTMGQRMDDLFETMIHLYLKEETSTIWSLMRRIGENGFVTAQNNTQYAEFQRVIVDRRNTNMVIEAEKLINQGAAFIAVGALHLPGTKGMLSILAQKGYRISRVEG